MRRAALSGAVLLAAMALPAPAAAIRGERVVVDVPAAFHSTPALAGSRVVLGHSQSRTVFAWRRGDVRSLLELGTPPQHRPLAGESPFELLRLAASPRRIAVVQAVVARDIRFEDVVAQEVVTTTFRGAKRQLLYCGRGYRRCRTPSDYTPADVDVSGDRVAVSSDPRGRQGVYVRDYGRGARRRRSFLPVRGSGLRLAIAGRYVAFTTDGSRHIRVWDWMRKRRLYSFRVTGFRDAFDLDTDGRLAVALTPPRKRPIVGVVSRRGRLRILRVGAAPEAIWFARRRIAYQRHERRTTFVVHDLARRRTRRHRPTAGGFLRDFDGRCLLWSANDGERFRVLVAPGLGRPGRRSACS